MGSYKLTWHRVGELAADVAQCGRCLSGVTSCRGTVWAVCTVWAVFVGSYKLT